MLPWLGGGGAVPRAPGNPASSPSSYSILKRERGKLGGNCGISGVVLGRGGEEDGRQGEGRLAGGSKMPIALVSSSAPE